MPSNRLDQSAFASLYRLTRSNWQIALFLACIFMSLYGYELFHYTLSIDEEIDSFASSVWSGWLSQGRWGMALISTWLPPIGAMPFLSSALFGFGLILGTLILLRLFNYDPGESLLFGAIFVLSPIWPHIVEFSTLSYGIGIGLVVFCIGVHFAMQQGRASFSMAVLLLSFSIAIYQTFSVLAALVMVNVALLHCMGKFRSDSLAKTNLPWILLRGSLALALAVLVYFGIELVALRAFGVEVQYIQNYLRLADYVQSFEYALKTSLSQALGFIMGTDQAYIGFGGPIVLLPMLGLVVSLWHALFHAKGNARAKTIILLLVVAAVSISVFPFLLSVGGIPARALIWLPLLFAMFGTMALHLTSARLLLWVFLGFNILASSYISNALFYSDALARDQDQVVAYDLIQKIENLRRAPVDQQTPFTLVGAHQSQFPVKRVEAFGGSFFGWDGGNVFRVHLYLALLGVRGLNPIDVADAPTGVVLASLAMPSWPAPESVKWVGDVLVIKFSDMTYEQRNRFCNVHAADAGMELCK